MLHLINKRHGYIDEMKLFYSDIWRRQLGATLFYWGIVPTLVLGSGVGLDRLLRLPVIPETLLLVAASVLLLGCGVSLIVWSTVDLQRIGGGTPSPFRPARQLVTIGSYRLCRHPMFFGYDLMLLGAILLIRSVVGLVVSYPLFIAWSVVLLRREERILSSRFRESYRHYQQSTPFLVPFIRTREGPP